MNSAWLVSENGAYFIIIAALKAATTALEQAEQQLKHIMGLQKSSVPTLPEKIGGKSVIEPEASDVAPTDAGIQPDGITSMTENISDSMTVDRPEEISGNLEETTVANSLAGHVTTDVLPESTEVTNIRGGSVDNVAVGEGTTVTGNTTDHAQQRKKPDEDGVGINSRKRKRAKAVAKAGNNDDTGVKEVEGDEVEEGEEGEEIEDVEIKLPTDLEKLAGKRLDCLINNWSLISFQRQAER